MKKTLSIILAFVFVLGIAGAAMAAPANPFVDVPAKHWAYDAVSKLAKAGVVDGYGDGTFRGDRTMTRYEMAQVVAKAMARSDKADAATKALIDKLAVEFAAELNNLGVRVAKLEEKTRIGINYETRIRYGYDSNKADNASGTKSFDWRQRVYFNGAVNDNVAFFARMEASNNNFGDNNTGKNVVINRAGFNVNNFLGAFDTLTVGRFGTMGWTPGLMQSKTSNNDGISVVKKFGETTFRASTFDVGNNSQVNFYSLGFKPSDTFKLGVAYQTTNLAAGQTAWLPVNPAGSPGAGLATNDLKTKSWDVNAVAKLGIFSLTGEYVSTKEVTNGDKTRKAYAIQLTNGITDAFYPVFNIVDPAKAHTDAFAVSYRSIDANAVPVTSGFSAASNVFQSAKAGEHAYSPTMNYDNDVKGYYVTYQNVVSKNVVWTLEYQSLKSKEAAVADGYQFKDNVWNTSFQFFF